MIFEDRRFLESSKGVAKPLLATLFRCCSVGKVVPFLSGCTCILNGREGNRFGGSCKGSEVRRFWGSGSKKGTSGVSIWSISNSGLDGSTPNISCICSRVELELRLKLELSESLGEKLIVCRDVSFSTLTFPSLKVVSNTIDSLSSPSYVFNPNLVLKTSSNFFNSRGRKAHCFERFSISSMFFVVDSLVSLTLLK